MYKQKEVNREKVSRLRLLRWISMKCLAQSRRIQDNRRLEGKNDDMPILPKGV